MTSLTITSMFAGLMALMMVVLSFQVSLRRVKLGVVFGDADDAVLRRRARAHGNFIEYAPFAVGVIALLELLAAPAVMVWSVAGLLAGTRVLHALGMLYSQNPAPRAIAMLVQHVTFLVAGIWLLTRAFAAA